MRRHLRIFPFRALFNRISRLVRSCYLRWAMNNNEREYILNVSINARGSGVTILANNATGNDGCVDDGSDVGGSDDGDGTGKEREKKKSALKTVVNGHDGETDAIVPGHPIVFHVRSSRGVLPYPAFTSASTRTIGACCIVQGWTGARVLVRSLPSIFLTYV